jgi:drug/metabolite transporter (DMT)-like permease
MGRPNAMSDVGRQGAMADRAEPDRLTVLAFAVVILLGGLNGIAAKQILRELEPFWSGVIRFAIAGIIMLAIVVATRRALPRGRSLLGAMAYGALGFALTFGLFFTGLRDTPISTAAAFLALTPVMTFGLAIAHGQEQFRLQGLVGALIALVGVALIFADQLAANIPLGSLLLLLLGVLCLAETGVIVKLIPRSDPVGTNAVGMLTGCGVLLLVSLFTAERRGLPTEPITWAALLYLVTLGSVVLFGLFVYTLERWTASAVSYSDLLIPLVTIAIATLLTGERFTPWFLLGGGVVLAGVYIGSFLHPPRRRTATTSVPECLPLEKRAAPAESPS